MNEENIIKTIEIEIGETVAKVTPEQLLKLHAAIAELLNLKTEKVVEREIVRDRFVPYSQPFWYWNPNTITVGGAGSTQPPFDKFIVSYTATSNTANLQIQ